MKKCHWVFVISWSGALVATHIPVTTWGCIAIFVICFALVKASEAIMGDEA